MNYMVVLNVGEESEGLVRMAIRVQSALSGRIGLGHCEDRNQHRYRRPVSHEGREGTEALDAPVDTSVARGVAAVCTPVPVRGQTRGAWDDEHQEQLKQYREGGQEHTVLRPALGGSLV